MEFENLSPLLCLLLVQLAFENLFKTANPIQRSLIYKTNLIPLLNRTKIHSKSLEIKKYLTKNFFPFFLNQKTLNQWNVKFKMHEIFIGLGANNNFPQKRTEDFFNLKHAGKLTRESEIESYFYMGIFQRWKAKYILKVASEVGSFWL